MQSHFELPLNLPCKPSRAIAVLLAIMYAGAALALILASISPWLIAGGVAALAGGCGMHLRRFLAEGDRVPPQLLFAAGDRWLLSVPGAEAVELKLLTPSFVHEWLVVLRFTANGGMRHTFLFTSDNCDPDLLRRLRVRLRYPNTGSGAGQAAGGTNTFS